MKNTLDVKQIRRNLRSELAKIRVDTMPLSERPKVKKDGWTNITNQISNMSAGGLSKFSGWANTMTGLGVDGIDSRGSASIEWRQIDWNSMESIYAADDVAKLVCDLIVQEGTRKGFKLTKINPEDSQNLINKFDKLNGSANFFRSGSWARLYGGCAILVGVEDGEKNLSIPLNINRVKRVTSLTPLHRFELYHDGTEVTNDPTSKNFGLPVVYNLISSRAPGVPMIRIHHTRLIRFEGALLPQRFFIANYYWHDSIFNRMSNALRNFHTGHDSCAAIMADFRQAVLSLKDLAGILSKGDEGDQEIIHRVQIINMVKSILKVMVIDADSEKYERQTVPLTGIKEVMDRIDGRMVAAANVPHTRILGDSPTGGLSGKGESEQNDFYDSVISWQENNYVPQLQYLFWMITNSQEFSGIKDKEKITIKCNPLKEHSEKEISEINLEQATADEKNIMNGVLTSEEVRTSRFAGEEGFSLETVLDKTNDATRGKLNDEGKKQGKKEKPTEE